VELNVRIVAGGEGTTFIHQRLREGDRVTIKGPYGRFFVRKSVRKPLIFMAGGSGLSSPRSMILDLLEHGWDSPLTLIYGQRIKAELYYHDEFVALAKQYVNFHYVPALSDEPSGSGWTGFRGFVHEAAAEAFPDGFAGHQAYLCGPPVMIDACVTALMQGRLFEDDIYFEKFISAADAQQVRSPLFRKI
jgi:phenol hydroxylase P5 protein